jgi:hypothetical protein
MRSLFGWNYPPGAASDPLAPYNQADCSDDCDGEDCGDCELRKVLAAEDRKVAEGLAEDSLWQEEHKEEIEKAIKNILGR